MFKLFRSGNASHSLVLALVTGVSFIAYLLFINPLKERDEHIYSTDKLDPEKLRHIRFKDVTSEWGLEYSHRFNTKKLFFIAPAVTLYDFDKNGYLDILYSGGKEVALYLNFGDGKFVESSHKYPFAGMVQSSMAVLADLNRDGFTDIWFSRVGEHRLYLGTADNNFVDRTELLNGYASFPDGVNFIDFNKDGRLDVVVGNFLELVKAGTYMTWYLPRRYASKDGGENHLLIQKDDGSFVVNEKVNFIHKMFTHSVGISDVNNDGYPDIFFANDYDKDQMFLNNNGESVVDVTNEYIPKRWHGNSGMNAEFMDMNQDGLIDLYVTYIHKPPFYRMYNMLWLKKPDGTFEPSSWDTNIGKCGFSWGAKAADFNLDGQLDLFVVNGRDRDSRIKKPEDGKSFWYPRTQLTSMPNFLLHHLETFERESGYLYHNSGFERDCLFIAHNGEYYDVAPDIGLMDRQEGRGLAIGDLNNDGLMDIVLVNTKGTSKVYINESTPEGTWIGFTLINKDGSDLPIGARIRLKQSDGPDLVREYYPANGYRSQSDNRLHFGLKKGSKPLELHVTWPYSEKTVIYKNFEPEKYNTIYED